MFHVERRAWLLELRHRQVKRQRANVKGQRGRVADWWSFRCFTWNLFGRHFFTWQVKMENPARWNCCFRNVPRETSLLGFGSGRRRGFTVPLRAKPAVECGRSSYRFPLLSHTNVARTGTKKSGSCCDRTTQRFAPDHSHKPATDPPLAKSFLTKRWRCPNSCNSYTKSITRLRPGKFYLPASM
jgi:hypothetical protein